MLGVLAENPPPTAISPLGSSASAWTAEVRPGPSAFHVEPLRSATISLFNTAPDYARFLGASLVVALLHVLAMSTGAWAVGRELREGTLPGWLGALRPEPRPAPHGLPGPALRAGRVRGRHVRLLEGTAVQLLAGAVALSLTGCDLEGEGASPSSSSTSQVPLETTSTTEPSTAATTAVGATPSGTRPATPGPAANSSS